MCLRVCGIVDLNVSLAHGVWITMPIDIKTQTPNN